MNAYDPAALARTLAPFDFRVLTSFNDGEFCVYRGDRLDTSDWELHPDTDELLMVLAGSVTVEILTAHDSTLVPLAAGQFAVVPKGHWHRHTRVHDVIEMFYTPGRTIESVAEDPRLTDDTARVDAEPGR